MYMSKTTTWLVANWKMNGNAERVQAWAFAVNQHLGAHRGAVVGVFCPPSIYITDAALALPANAQLRLGAQNCHGASKGAYTGELAAAMLTDKGCAFVIVGHSECRVKGECDETVAAKATAALAAGITPIVCVGESLAACESHQTLATLTRQLKPLADLPVGGYLIAYEPNWAIGSNRTPALAEILAAHSHIKSVLGSSVDVLYGGSVNASNAVEILALPEVSGALIGGASLEIDSMCALISGAATTK
jgi:triosephosphate isomerase